MFVELPREAGSSAAAVGGKRATYVALHGRREPTCVKTYAACQRGSGGRCQVDFKRRRGARATRMSPVLRGKRCRRRALGAARRRALTAQHAAAAPRRSAADSRSMVPRRASCPAMVEST